MTRDKCINEYFDWMYGLVCDHFDGLSFRKLLSYLYDKEFTYTVGMDGNRAEDGMDLRYRFAYESYYNDAMISEYLDDKDCSVLEMMVALTIRCEENIMDNPDFGDRTGLWFWNMLESLRLDNMSDDAFDDKYVDRVIEKFLNHEYERNGKGGLFTVPRSKHDLRTVEIWTQMCWYLDSIL